MTRQSLWWVLTWVVMTGCGGAPPDGVMVAVPPPASWEERILSDRAERDRYFREDPETPLLTEDLPGFDGLDYWDPDPRYRFVGPLEVYDTREPLEIITTSGKVRPGERYGRVTFELDGRLRSLEVYRLLDTPGGPSLFLPFTDRTSGVETYPAGRYIELDGEEGGRYVMDFNVAYNPFCAYGAPDRYVCPVTPPENRLDVRIEAGERGYKKETASGAS